MNTQMPNSKALEKNRFLAVLEGGTGRIIFNLTSGAFLVGFLKYLGASDTVCGYILTIPVLAATIQFLAPMVLEKLQWRKPIIILGSALHRFMLSAMILVAFLPIPQTARLWVIGLFYLLSYFAVSFITPAVSNMYVSFVDPASRGSYFGARERWILLLSTVMNLVMGKVLDMLKEGGNELYGHIVIYAMIFLTTIINTWSFLGMKEVPLQHSPEVLKLKEIFLVPLKNPQFRLFFGLSVMWNISLQIAGAYFGVYQVSDLALTYTQINLLSMLTSAFYFLTAEPWGRIADKTSWSFTTMLSLAILGFTHILWFFMSKDSPLLAPLLVFAFMTGGIAWGGINVSLFNLQFDYTPAEKRTVYIGFNSAISGLLGYLASVLGAWMVGAFANWSINGPFPIAIKQVLFITSGVLLTCSALYILIFMKPKRIGLGEIRRISKKS